MFPKSSRTFFWQNSSLVDGSGGFSIIGSPQSNFFVVSSRTIFNRRMCKREANDEHAMKPIAALWKRNDAADPGHDTSKSSAIPADSVGFWWVGVVVFFQIFLIVGHSIMYRVVVVDYFLASSGIMMFWAGGAERIYRIVQHPRATNLTLQFCLGR